MLGLKNGLQFRIHEEIDKKHALQIYQNDCGKVHEQHPAPCLKMKYEGAHGLKNKSNERQIACSLGQNIEDFSL